MAIINKLTFWPVERFESTYTYVYTN